ncbi:hypothetical protein J437_LFUL000910 [Ladona fulva]|uniref:Ig-like domain-containing protein n=1 Tax=Ladona fulva TaxID=123851 RepID=A0A8K0K6M8_LADFU|nr:hypothetical protein J437_LFUL000910 [Ladona fulva]
MYMGHLDVVVPPDIINEETSGDVMVPEGGTVKLTCHARGYPVPHVLWRREDNADIVIREPSGVKTKGNTALLTEKPPLLKGLEDMMGESKKNLTLFSKE